MKPARSLWTYCLMLWCAGAVHAQLLPTPAPNLQRTPQRLAPTPGKVLAGGAITSVSVTSVGPNDPLLVKGQGFGPRDGKLRVAIAPGRTVDAVIEAWSDTVVVARMPDVGGVPTPFHGELLLERLGSSALKAPLTFQPATETRTLLALAADTQAASPSEIDGNVCHPACRMGVNPALLVGNKGDDRFFQGRKLRNGWKLSSVSLASVSGGAVTSRPIAQGRADATLTEQHVGSDNPQVSVHWWNDAFGSVGYLPVLVITGPKGVPHW